MEKSNVLSKNASRVQSQHHTHTDSVPCLKCHKLMIEIHGQKALCQIANGSTEGRDYVFQLVERQKARRTVLGGSRRLSKHRAYKDMKATLAHCVCVAGKSN